MSFMSKLKTRLHTMRRPLQNVRRAVQGEQLPAKVGEPASQDPDKRPPVDAAKKGPAKQLVTAIATQSVAAKGAAKPRTMSALWPQAPLQPATAPAPNPLFPEPPRADEPTMAGVMPPPPFVAPLFSDQAEPRTGLLGPSSIFGEKPADTSDRQPFDLFGTRTRDDEPPRLF